jgi:hypothetical protein
MGRAAQVESGATTGVCDGARTARTLHRDRHQASQGEVIMLWTVAVVLVVLWLLGLVSSYTMGGFIHVLLVVAVVVVLVRIIQGRRPI